MSHFRLAALTLVAGFCVYAQSGSVNFLGSDVATKGTWKGVYGQDGNVIVQNSAIAPSYSVFDVQNSNSYVYNYYSTDSRALQKYVFSYSASERIASYFHATTYMDFNVSLRDTAWHRLALYFCDHENAGRSVTVQARDVATGNILDTQVLDTYSTGIYLVYSYRGSVIFRVTNNHPSGPTGSLSGIFWGGNGGPTPDSTPPTVNITSPGATSVSGLVSLSANASDNIGVAGVQFLVDTVNVGAEVAVPPYTTSWNSTAAANGPHTITAIARDGAGNHTTSAPVVATVQNAAPDLTPPDNVMITSPGPNATLSGTTTITANAHDNVGVVGVQFKIDGGNAGAEVTTLPYSYLWNTTNVGNGSHQITATARDAAGNSSSASPVSVMVSNAPPPSGNVVTFLAKDTVTLGNWKGVYGQDGNIISYHSMAPPSYAWYDLRGVNQYLYDLWPTDPRALYKYLYSYSATERIESQFYSRFFMDIEVTTRDNQTHRIAFYFCDWNRIGRSITMQAIDPSTNAILDSRALTDYTGGVYLVYNYRGDILFRVKNNNPSDVTSPNATFSGIFWGGTSAPPGDSTPPTISISSPASFQYANVSDRIAYGPVSGAFTLGVNASDDTGVAGVQYQLDGVNIGPEQTVAPFTYLWDSSTVADSIHTLRAVARDPANNTATSANVSISVVNHPPPTDFTPPAVSISPIPNSGALSGTVDITATATDAGGIRQVYYLLNGADISPTWPHPAVAPWHLYWNTDLWSSGSYTITAVAWDLAGNATFSAPVNVTIKPRTGNQATYLSTDLATQGNWKTVYGQDGNVIVQNSNAIPSYASYWAYNVDQYLYNFFSTDPRALAKYVFSYSANERIAAYFLAANYMEFDVSATDTIPHRIALYFCDYESLGRSVTVQAIDNTSGTVLDTRTLNSYTSGVYLVYRYQGKVKFRVTNAHGASNGAGSISGIFWGGPIS